MGVENIKIGPCRVTFGNDDLGYTLGGVTFNIKSIADPQSYMGSHPNYDYIAGGTEVSVDISLVELSIDTLKKIFPLATYENDTLSIKDNRGQKLRQYAKTLTLEPQDNSEIIRLPLAFPLVNTSTTLTFGELRAIGVSFISLCKSKNDNTLLEFAKPPVLFVTKDNANFATSDGRRFGLP